MSPRSTRDEIRAYIDSKGHGSPPASLSDEEMKALIESGRFRAEPVIVDDSGRFRRSVSGDDGPAEMPLSMSLADRNFWFNLVIGCSGPDATSRVVLPNDLRSRNAAKLQYAVADVRRLRDFVNRHMFTGPELVFPLGQRLFAGTFAETLYLEDASSADLDKALVTMSSFFEKNEKDPEWMGGQVNLFFAGHGADRPDLPPSDRGGLVLKDRAIGPEDLQYRLMAALPKSVIETPFQLGAPGNCRVDMYLDCCYSGQFAAAFIGRLFYDCKGLVPGRVWCSSMPFQESFEDPQLQHGVFTSYFLNDYSTRSTFARTKTPSLKSGDVGKDTRHDQNPFLVDFSTDRPILLTIPGATGTTATMKNFPITEEVTNGGDPFARWLTDYLKAVHRNNW